MPGSYRLGKFFGVPVDLHFSMFIGIIILAVINTFSGLAWYWVAALGVAKGCAVYASVLAHEYGHVLAARKLGYSTEKIVLMILGGAAMMRVNDMDSRPKDTIKVSIAGPIVSVSLGAIFFLGALFLNQVFALTMGNPFVELFLWLAAINIVLFVFNVLPITPLDGGRIYRALLSMKFGVLKATDIAFRSTVVLASALAIFGVVSLNFGLTFIAVFLIVIANQERKNTYTQHQGY